MDDNFFSCHESGQLSTLIGMKTSTFWCAESIHLFQVTVVYLCMVSIREIIISPGLLQVCCYWHCELWIQSL